MQRFWSAPVFINFTFIPHDNQNIKSNIFSLLESIKKGVDVCSLISEGNEESCVDVRICDQQGCYLTPGNEKKPAHTNNVILIIISASV
jgi:hypothetical protein